MSETIERKELEDLQQDLDGVRELLRRHRLVESLVERQHSAKHELVETLVHKQHLAELRAKLDEMHSADVAYILEALPINERLIVWDLVKAERDGEILLELSEPVRESVIRTMDSDELIAAVETLDTAYEGEIADYDCSVLMLWVLKGALGVIVEEPVSVITKDVVVTGVAPK